MARLARVVAPGVPHHITQRGNRRQIIFFCDEDYLAYIDLMADWCARFAVTVWAYCLMPNYVHLIVVPSSQDGLRRAIGEAHRRYSGLINSFTEHADEISMVSPESARSPPFFLNRYRRNAHLHCKGGSQAFIDPRNCYGY
jgi:REP element-mobilizing transposase RayT